jgi:hypothetical protein
MVNRSPTRKETGNTTRSQASLHQELYVGLDHIVDVCVKEVAEPRKER